MKNIYPLIMAAIMAVCLAGCNSVSVTDITSETLVHTTVTVVGAPVTRATGVTSAEEENIANLQILVFDESGALEHYLDAGSSATGDIVTKEGRKTVTAIINAPSLQDVATKNALMTKTSLLADNSRGSMVMTGEVEAVLQDGGKLNIPVTRIISKVMIKKITSAFPSTSTYASKPFRINSIYLINVAGDNTYAASSEPTIWYNKLANGQNDPGCRTFPLLADPVNENIAYKASYTKEHSFYCYPNLISDESFESTWSPRHTMLVVDAMLGGVQTYYPIELPVIGRNKCIIIEELVITKKGSDYPYIPVRDGSCDATVIVTPWDTILDYTETI
ncbi:MAG: hypothetical protein J6P69_08495 [Bacteroidales bacterium]|nr:hypothetical protein [Bacteroidales bacterium]